MPFSSIAAAASSQRRTRHGVSMSSTSSSIIGSVVPLLLIVLLASFSTGVKALSLPNSKSDTVPYFNPAGSTSSSSPSNIIAITHAAGRMGKLLALQLREDAKFRRLDRHGDLPVIAKQEEGNGNGDSNANAEDNDNANINGDDNLPRIRAIVRSEKEAYSVKCDLGGMTTVGGGVAKPNHLNWLETVIIDSDLEASEKASLLKESFEGCRAAILCDASHNELVWNDNETAGGEFSVVVPAAESRDLSKRLLEEINAASYSSTLQHVVLRSTMGLEVSLAAAAHRRYMDTVEPAGAPLEGAIDWEKLARAMGGEAALAGARESERAFRKMAEQNPSCRHTILRLGALTDDAGMVPLVFGNKDSILIKTTDDGTENYRPPILSRSDAARVSTVLVRKDEGNDESNSNAAVNCDSNATFGVNGDGDSNADTTVNIVTVDCAWHPKYGRDSVGREETVSAAGRQDLKKAIRKALPEPQPITSSSILSQL